MVLAGHFKCGPAVRRSLMSVLMLAAALVLTASAAPAASAGPAQEEYKLQIPDARGGGDSSSPGEARSLLSDGGPSPGATAEGTSRDRTSSYPGAGSRTGDDSGGSADGGGSSDGYDALLAKGREGAGDSGLLSAGTSAVGKTPIGLAVLAALLLIAVAGALAVRRRGRASRAARSTG